jgi:hypothetical protein
MNKQIRTFYNHENCICKQKINKISIQKTSDSKGVLVYQPVLHKKLELIKGSKTALVYMLINFGQNMANIFLIRFIQGSLINFP